MNALDSIVALCALDEGTIITDANGVEYTLFSTGRPTTNPNWITWVGPGGTNTHSDDITLPATVNGRSPDCLMCALTTLPHIC